MCCLKCLSETVRRCPLWPQLSAGVSSCGAYVFALALEYRWSQARLTGIISVLAFVSSFTK